MYDYWFNFGDSATFFYLIGFAVYTHREIWFYLPHPTHHFIWFTSQMYWMRIEEKKSLARRRKKNWEYNEKSNLHFIIREIFLWPENQICSYDHTHFFFIKFNKIMNLLKKNPYSRHHEKSIKLYLIIILLHLGAVTNNLIILIFRTDRAEGN